MRISHGTDPFGRHLYQIEPEEHDGQPPVPHVWIDGRLRAQAPDRLCLAEAILFRSYIGGPVTFSAACTPRTAQALRRLLSPRNAPILSVAANAARPLSGWRTATVGPGEAADLAVELAPDGRQRTMIDPDQAVFASSLRALHRASGDETATALALAVLFAEDLAIGRIVVARDHLRSYGDDALAALAAAAADVGLTLAMTPGTGG